MCASAYGTRDGRDFAFCSRTSCGCGCCACVDDEARPPRPCPPDRTMALSWHLPKEEPGVHFEGLDMRPDF